MPLGAVAEVRVNGVPAGVVWDQPYALPLRDVLRRGENTIELVVGGTSLPAMRSDAWKEIFQSAREQFGARFDMQDIAEVDEPADNGLLVAPTLLLTRGRRTGFVSA